MCLRVLAQVTLLSLFLVVGPVAVRTVNRERSAGHSPASQPGSPYIDAKRAGTLSEKQIIDYLATPETTNVEIARLLEALGRFDKSHTAVTALIYWLGFEAWDKPQNGDGVSAEFHF